jgi:hypothetical protein
MTSRSFFAVGLAALALAAAGCGGDDEKSAATTETTSSGGSPTKSVQTESPRTETESTETTGTQTGDDKGGGNGTGGAKSPEDQPGGAGDEVPASSLAQFTGKGGKLTPSVVSVPPFLAIQVELRSADGASYALRAGTRRLEVGGDVKSRATSFGGLRPGKSLVLSGPQGKVAVVADAEPGP